ncbi:MAG TPA: D-hexose-6-phosphate mutarotase [Pirellulales bacterium]|jgi:glucose-6-phosphate 1-epimerase|nr:D-hexose-6-phosphate mutarotase [Pirellulales bacterium]
MDSAAIAELDRRLGIPGVARVAPGNGALAKVTVATPEAAGEMYLHGGHVTGWRPRGADEVLFVSSQSRWEPGRAIRGGVPVCLPWFAGRADDPKAPAHGVVRTVAWRLDSIGQAGDGVTVSMSTESNDTTKKWWPADFRLVHRATFGPELVMALEVTNTGTTALRFEEALHAYFRVGQIDTVRVEGLATYDYVDKTDANRKRTQQGAITITGETDRVYLGTQDPIELADGGLGRRVRVAKENSRTTVVWNPWIEKSKALSDFGDDEWKTMICLEACNVADFAVTLQPAEQHTMKMRIGVENR